MCKSVVEPEENTLYSSKFLREKLLSTNNFNMAQKQVVEKEKVSFQLLKTERFIRLFAGVEYIDDATLDIGAKLRVGLYDILIMNSVEKNVRKGRIEYFFYLLLVLLFQIFIQKHYLRNIIRYDFDMKIFNRLFESTLFFSIVKVDF